MSEQIDPFDGAPELPRIVAVGFLPVGHLYNFLAGGLTLRRGDRVVVESEAGVRIGTVEVEPHEPSRTLDLRALHPVLRLAEAGDVDSETENLDREAAARRLCLHRIRERNLAMKLISVDYMLDGRKAVFYFTAENRIDFRDWCATSPTRCACGSR